MTKSCLLGKGHKNLIAIVLIFVLMVGLVPSISWAAEENNHINVTFSFVYEDSFEVIPQQLAVKAGLAYSYGLGDIEKSYPTVLDAVVAAHEVKYGHEFTKETVNGFMDSDLYMAFGRQGYGGHAINRSYSADAAKDAKINNNDTVEIFFYLDAFGCDYYSILNSGNKVFEINNDIELVLKGFCYAWDGGDNPQLTPIAGANISIIDLETGKIQTVEGKVTDSNGIVTLNFDNKGTYYISAIGFADYNLSFSGVEMPIEAQIIPTWHKIYVVDVADPHVTVRIEGNGHGIKDGEKNIETVLEETVVPLSKLPENPNAINAINQALDLNGLNGAALDENNYYAPISFGEVTYEPGYNWDFVINDAQAKNGVAGQPVQDGDSIVMYLTGDGDSGNYRADPYYSYFSKKSEYFDDNGPYAEIDLVLKQIVSIDWVDHIKAVTNAGVNVTASVGNESNYSCSQTTDGENGILNFSCWGLGEYIISAEKVIDDVNTISRPYCKVVLSEDGIKVSTYSSEKNTDIGSLSLTFGDKAQIEGTGYLYGDPLIVNNVIDNVSVSAEASDGEAQIKAKYKSADENDFNEYSLGADQVGLDVGNNIFKLEVTNGGDSYIHTLIIRREKEEIRDIATEVSMVVNGVCEEKGTPPSNDWILAMKGAGMDISEPDKRAYLTSALSKIEDFYKGGSSYTIGHIAKIGLSLTSLGIDVRQIPNSNNPDVPIDLIEQIANYPGNVDINNAPYILSLYDIEGNKGEKIYIVPLNAIQSRANLIETILKGQNKETGLFSSIDSTGIVLPALAPYYLADMTLNDIELEQIKDSVNVTIEALSAKQSIDGGFGSRNSSTTATAIIGLTALGIDPHEDGRFIKSGSSLITDLLSFRTPDNKLGFTNNLWSSEMSSTQGFLALTAYQNLKGSRNSNIYHFDANVGVYTNWPDAKLLTSLAVTKLPTKVKYNIGEELDTSGIEVTAYYNRDPNNNKVLSVCDYSIEQVDTSSEGTKQVTVSYQGHRATFNISVRDAGGTTPQEKTVKITIRSSGKGTIASNNAYVIESGKTTVMDVLKAVLSGAGKTYVIPGDIYVSEIDGLGEFSEGGNSGWKYYVDGLDPDYTAANYKLKGGEVIEWRFTLDYTSEKGSEKWNENAQPTETSANVSEKELKSIIEEIKSGKKDSWQVDLAGGSINFDRSALETLLGQMSSPVEISIEETSSKMLSQKQKEAVKDRPIFDITAKSGKKTISKFDGKLTISLTYKLKEGEKPSGLVVYYMDEEGKLTLLQGKYDTVLGKIIFTVDHLSYFVIGYDETLVEWPFVDVSESDIDNWYYSAVKYVYDKGIFSGMSDTSFGPDNSLTRSMLVSVLARMSGEDLQEYKDSGFLDVDIKSWYGPSVAWAKDKGIVSGYSNKDASYSFKPDDKITRQDIAVMLNNFNEKIGRKDYEKFDTIGFVDQDKISSYAVSAVKTMQEMKIINGFKNSKGDYEFRPLNYATRAEAATLIKNMMTR